MIITALIERQAKLKFYKISVRSAKIKFMSVGKMSIKSFSMQLGSDELIEFKFAVLDFREIACKFGKSF